MELFFIGLALYLLVGPAFGFVAFRELRRSAGRADALARRVEAQGREIRTLTERLARFQPDLFGGGTVDAPEDPGIAETGKAGPSVPEAERAPAPSPPRAATQPAPGRQGGVGEFEQRLTARWLVWLGAVTLALGGGFLVKYAVDLGWLGPATRVALGFLLGCALAVGGEWLRERPLARAMAAVRSDYVPPALTGAGLSIAFTSIYAAFELYGLLSPLAAFLLLAITAVAGIALSLLQGRFIALLGLLGGFVAPLLVPAASPSAWGFFGYLSILVAAALGLVRYRAWWWLAGAALAGAALWMAIWFAALWRPGDAVASGAFLLGLAAMCLFVPRRAGGPPSLGVLGFPFEMSDVVAWAGACTVAALAFVLVRMDAYAPASLVTLALLAGLYGVAGRREPVLEGLPAVAAVLVTAVIAVWHLPEIVTVRPPLVTIEGEGIGVTPGPIVPPELGRFLLTAVGYAALFGIAGFAALWGGRRPALWASVSAATPVVLLGVAYWRIETFSVDLAWAAAALVLAALGVAAAARVARYRGHAGFEGALAAYAAGATAAISLGATMALEEAWLTVALSLQLPALARLHGRLHVRALRVLAAILAAMVLGRLALNPFVFDYAPGGMGAHWILYGYGIPMAAFLVAARRFRLSADDALVQVLEAGALVFGTLLVTLEIHLLIADRLTSPRRGLIEPSLQTIAWLLIALGLAMGESRWNRPTLRWGRRVLVSLAMAQIVLVQLLIENPVVSGAPVGAAPVLNALTLAYAVPGLLLLAYAWCSPRDGRVALLAGILGLVLLFADVSLEVRRHFQGPILSAAVAGDAEWYAYSVVWLAYAAVLLGLGLALGNQAFRHASLALVLITTGKVFLSDMGDLSGLYRAASFLGLGLCLVGIGYLYQRFVFPVGGSGRQSEAR